MGGEPWASAVTALLAVAFAVLMARPLNVLAAGELRARSVGMRLEAWRSFVFIGCAALTAVAVVSAGTVGFVGLITPHMVRLAFRTSDHRMVAPASALLGGTLLACADVVARTVVAPTTASRRRDHGAGRRARSSSRCCASADEEDLI